MFGKVADDKCVLMLMMHTHMFPEYLEQINTSIKDDDRILSATSSFFDQSEFQVYLNAADVAVLPFVDVLTSGSALLALSFGKPVILPGIGCLLELIDDSMGRLFDPESSDDFQDAMTAIRKQDISALSAAALKRAESLHWDGIAEQLIALYQG